MKIFIVLSLCVVGNFALNIDRNRVARNVDVVANRDRFDPNLISKDTIDRFDQNVIKKDTTDTFDQNLVEVHGRDRTLQQLVFRERDRTNQNLAEVHGRDRVLEQQAFTNRDRTDQNLAEVHGRDRAVQEQAFTNMNRAALNEGNRFLHQLTFREYDNTDRFPTEENMFAYYNTECDKVVPNVHDDKTYREHLICVGNKFKIINDQAMMDTKELLAGLEGLMGVDTGRSILQRCLLSIQDTHDSPTVELLYCIDKARSIVPYNPIGRHLDDN